ncbi:MAG: AAA family ATPase [Alicyclobacillus macrosporangiidus]|uniref:AAA family ATPase n=1 Tax=Alicyclobacillus macrosporangiidus TaxID=392015 RepID=UPI0026EF963A|nr:AAA family ATPase [Alicyclobacillus macrosporangiidus]MCL6597496.1 AAA family ATPase [Alicyclobacillus macrosporangiidus]
MLVRIRGWSYRNIRGVYDLDVSLLRDNSSPYPCTLIMMPNGTGKTTTMTLLRAVFTGEATKWSQEQVREFKPTGRNVTDGEFKATLTIDGNVYVVVIQLNYEYGTANYRTSRINSGYEYGHLLPLYARNVFTKRFVERFIFDGELAKEILSSGKNEAEQALKYLYQINYLSELSEEISKVVDDIQKRSERTTSAKTPHALRRFKEEKEAIEQRLNKLRERESNIRKELSQKEQRLSKVRSLKSEYLQSDQTIQEQVEQLSTQQRENDKIIAEGRQSAIDLMRRPHMLSPVIASRLTDLASKMHQLKLPRELSRQFFEDLANQPRCVCGREIGDNERQTILAEADKYLGEDQIGVMNSIKQSIKNSVYTPALADIINDLNSAIQTRRELQRDWNALQVQRRNSGDETFNELDREESELEQRIATLKDELKRLTTRDREEQIQLAVNAEGNIPKCEELLDEVVRRYHDVAGTLKWLDRKKRAKTYLENIEKRAMKKLKEIILAKTNEKIAMLLRNEHITVDRIDGHLSLTDKAGASVGQTLAIAYAYLGSLFSSSSYDLPFVVDSPAGSLDLDVRRNVSSILPELFGQLIVFITSGERQGFAEQFYLLGDQVQYLTIFRDEQEGVVCSTDLNTFQKFQEDQVLLTYLSGDGNGI